jgi:hypothetical protein
VYHITQGASTLLLVVVWVMAQVKTPVRGHELDRYRLLREAEEDLAAAFRSTPSGAEREPIQVEIEMLPADGPLVGCHQPPLRSCARSGHQRDVELRTLPPLIPQAVSLEQR